MDLQVELEQINEDEVRLIIAVEQGRVNGALDNAYRRASRGFTIPGFRPGKAPRPLFERSYGTQRLYEDALQDLVPKVYGEAVEELKLRPYEDADIEEITPADDGIMVKAHVLLEPEVELPDYRALPMEQPELAEVDAAQIDRMTDELRRERATLVPSDEVAAGDVVEVSGYFLDKEGQLQPFERTAIEVDRAYDAFREALLGAHVGDEHEVAPGPDDQDARSAHVKVEDIRHIELPELTDEFAQEMGHAGLKEMREWLANALREESSRQAEQARRSALLDRIVSEAKVRLPQALVEREAHRLQHEQAHAEHEHEHEHEPADEHEHGDPDEATLEQARARVRQRLVVERLMQAEGIALRQAEFDAARKALEERRGRTLADAELQSLYGILLDEKLSVFLGTLGVETPAE